MDQEQILERIAEFFGNTQRPYSTIILSTAIAVACCIKETASVAIPVAGMVLGGNAASRAVEKVKLGANEADVKKTAINAGTSTSQVDPKVPS